MDEFNNCFFDGVNDNPPSGWLGLVRPGRISPTLWAGEDKSTSALKRCSCNPPQADLKTTNQLKEMQGSKSYITSVVSGQLFCLKKHLGRRGVGNAQKQLRIHIYKLSFPYSF